jgi:uncharacterized protein YprB with RNaseH-like and TPR domain
VLKNTFCHIPGISASTEQRLWASGIQCWEALRESGATRLLRKKADSLARHLDESFASLEKNDLNYFAELLPTIQHWRLFRDSQRSIAYLDIETTGLGYSDSITTIVVYDGQSTHHYVRHENLDQFKEDIKKYALIVTYNGKCFDVPFLERSFGIRIDQAHIDLRYVLKSLGYSGGLKACERQLGIDRKDLRDVDGFFAVLLWNDFIKNKNHKALETLLAYNTCDVINLETLMVIAYNLKLKETPFRESHQLNFPQPPPVAFKADKATIDRLMRSGYAGRYYGGRYHGWR